MDSLRFLIDEDVPTSAAHVLAERGYPVEYVAQINQRAADSVVFQMAEDRHSVLVTKNRRHFDKLWNRRTSKAAKRFGHGGMVYLRLGKHESEAARRVRECIDVVEFEWKRSRKLDDKTILIDIHIDVIRISR